MSLHYLLDGYNILHQMPIELRGKLEDQRHQLIQWIENHRPQGSIKNSVTIVFDGQSGIYGGDRNFPSVKVIFSQDESADEKIKSLVAQASNKKNIIVVTNDRDIQYAVKASGAKVMPVEEFLALADKRHLRSAQNSSKHSMEKESSSKVSTSMEYKITSEMEQIWLKSKKGK